MNAPGNLKPVLEKLYAAFNDHSLIPPDPLGFVYRWKEHADIELAGLLSSALAYGRVGQIEKNLNRLFEILAPSPYAFLLDMGRAERKKLQQFRHRFNTGQDIADLLGALRTIYRQNSTLEEFFAAGFSPNDSTIIPALSRFCSSVLKIHLKTSGRAASAGLQYLLVNPEKNSPCKRLNLFLRWMVRSDNIDTGLWKSIPATALIYPIDAHIGRISRILGFCDNKNISLKTAVKITEQFARFAPDDPVKYDFALCRMGMITRCNSWLDIKKYAAGV